MPQEAPKGQMVQVVQVVQAVQVVRERSTRERGLADAPHQWLWEV